MVKDGANRVCCWYDKFNYAVGTNILPDSLDFLDANWTSVGGVTKLSDYSFSTVGDASLRNLNYTWTINTTYRLRMRVKVTSGIWCEIKDYSGTNAYYSFLGNGDFKDIDTTITVTSISTNGFRIRAINTCTIEFEYLVIEPVAGNHLLQYTVSQQPVWSLANGLLFDGANDYLKALAFTYNQPISIYYVGRQITWINLKKLFDGNTEITGFIWNSNEGSPYVRANAGLHSSPNPNLPINVFSIIKVIFNGANSLFQINKTAEIIGNFGTNNMNGFTLSARGNNIADFANTEVKEIILRRSADNAETQNSIYNYLSAVNGIT